MDKDLKNRAFETLQDTKEQLALIDKDYDLKMREINEQMMRAKTQDTRWGAERLATLQEEKKKLVEEKQRAEQNYEKANNDYEKISETGSTDHLKT